MRPPDGLPKNKFYLFFGGALQNAVHYIKQVGCIKDFSLNTAYPFSLITEYYASALCSSSLHDRVVP